MTDPSLRVFGARDARAVVLVLHGGQETSTAPAHRFRPAYLRMLPFARDLAWTGRAGRVAALALRNRVRGWNGPAMDPVADARWALAEIARRHPGVPVVLVGHSMGGRVALRVADDPAVTGVCALAPWTPPEEPVAQLAGRTVLIAHGDRDRITDPRLSLDYAARVKRVTGAVCRFDVRGETHAMLRRAREWRLLVRRFSLGVLGVTDLDEDIASALAKPPPGGLTVPL
ncbi:alpha/beta hydrolase [Actinophytocola gossypii]|uniref:Alpha/beta fold hydrolase n=1 Tax=Actinophytocola gossypii TaxID=2812003 RepID=A0ABT2J6B2_9PSEU|nr:lysophospholipase [Actinophytocola gossypii]MCT2583323.1 alpha/beta fold hydrolase [Actinophytocola gossypii]